MCIIRASSVTDNYISLGSNEKGEKSLNIQTP